MKILMLNYEFPPIGGGAANANYYLLKEFSKNKDIEIDLVTASPKNKFLKERFSKNITIHRLNVNKTNPNYQTFSETYLWSVKTYFTLGRMIQKKKYDLCHCWFGWPSGFFGYLWRKDIPYIIGLRGTDVPGFNPRFKQLDKIFWPGYSKIVWGYAKKLLLIQKG
jgi:glycosyltransferase involved in cell wall biosynthesis